MAFDDQPDATLTRDIEFVEGFGRNWLEGSVSSKTVLLAYLRSRYLSAPKPRKPFMPTAEMTDDILIDVGGEIITWGELQARTVKPRPLLDVDDQPWRYIDTAPHMADCVIVSNGEAVVALSYFQGDSWWLGRRSSATHLEVLDFAPIYWMPVGAPNNPLRTLFPSGHSPVSPLW